MRRIFIIAVVFLVFLPALASPAYAQDPDESFPGNPYNFEPADIPETDPPIVLGDLIRDVGFINAVGSYATTIWVILDNFAGGGVLGYFVIFLLGVSVIVFVARYVYNKPIHTESIKGGETRLDPTGYTRQWSEFGRELRRRKNMRF